MIAVFTEVLEARPAVSRPVLIGLRQSLASPGQQDGRDRLYDDDDVSPQRPALHVVTIEKDAPLIRNIIASPDLPGAGESGPRTEVEQDVLAVFLKFVDHHRARPDDAHLPAQNVDQLWQLIDAELTQHAAHGGKSRIILQLL